MSVHAPTVSDDCKATIHLKGGLITCNCTGKCSNLQYVNKSTGQWGKNRMNVMRLIFLFLWKGHFRFVFRLGVLSHTIRISYRELLTLERGSSLKGWPVSVCFCHAGSQLSAFLILSIPPGGVHVSRRACTQSKRAGPHCRCHHEESWLLVLQRQLPGGNLTKVQCYMIIWFYEAIKGVKLDFCLKRSFRKLLIIKGVFMILRWLHI